MSHKLIIANFKSNKNRKEYETWIDTFETYSKKIPSTMSVILAPSVPDLMLFSNRLIDKKIHPQTVLGVQDVSNFPAATYTVGVSPRDLAGLGLILCPPLLTAQ